MVYVLTQTDPLPVEPYLTVDEYRQAPTGVDTSGLVKGDQAASLAELGNVIARASSWADLLCNQVLAATPDMEGRRVGVSKDGILKIHPRFTPVVAVTAVSYGSTPNSLAALTDLSNVWIEPAQICVPLDGSAGVNSTFAGPLGFSAVRPGVSLFVQWKYIAGYPNTTLTATTTAGASSISVKTAGGIVGGATQLTIYDGTRTETVIVDPSYVTGSTTVPLTGPLVFAHGQVGVSVSALPPAAKQAVILLTSALIKTRGSSAMVMQSIRGEASRQARGEAGMMEEVEIADELLSPYRRVW